MSTKRQEAIFDAWQTMAWAWPAATAEFLIAVVTDNCRCNREELAEALYIVGKKRDVVVQKAC